MKNGIPFPEYIFTKDDGTPIHPDTFSKHLKALFAEIGLPKTYHLHTLRHFFVSTLLHEGVDKKYGRRPRRSWRYVVLSAPTVTRRCSSSRRLRNA